VIRPLIGSALGALALAADALGPAPGGPGLVLALAALVAAPRTTGTLSIFLGLTALGVALGDGDATLLTPLGWVAHVTLGLAMGATARHADGPTVQVCHEQPVIMALGLTGAAAFVGLLPDDLLQLMTAAGGPLHLGATLSEPELATRMAVSIPARLLIPPPMDALLFWVPPLAAVTAVALSLGGILGTPRALRAAVGMAAALALALVVPAIADLAQLLGGGPITLPPADQLIVELGWLSGGVTGLSLHDPPETAHLSLASRPVVSVLRLVVGLAFCDWLWTHRNVSNLTQSTSRPEAGESAAPTKTATPTTPSVGLGWCWGAVALAVFACAAFMGFVSADRIDAVAVWGPHPAAWTTAAGALIVAVAGLGSLFGERSARMAVGLEVLALGIWCCGILAPAAGWLTP